MIQENINGFVDWYVNNREGKGSSHLEKSYNGDKNLMVKSIAEFGNRFQNDYGFNPFDQSYQQMTSSHIYRIKNLITGKNILFHFSNEKDDSLIIDLLGAKNLLKFFESKLYGEEKGLFEDDKLEDLNCEIPLKEEFRNWLIQNQNHTKKGADSYVSYVVVSSKNLIIHYLDPNIDVFSDINYYVEISDYKKAEDILNKSIQIVKDVAEDSVKTKFHNGLLKYKLFILEKISNLEK